MAFKSAHTPKKVPASELVEEDSNAQVRSNYFIFWSLHYLKFLFLPKVLFFDLQEVPSRRLPPGISYFGK